MSEDRWKAEIKETREVASDAVSFASTILAYHVLIYKFKNLNSGERRQHVKDVKKKIKLKLGKDAVIPEAVHDRLMGAISGK